MRDKISLHINNLKIENFLSYRIESDLFVADDAFEITLANTGAEISEGAQCKLYINDTLELNGIIDKITDSYDKGGSKLSIEGRDLLGLLIDSYCEEFTTLENVTLKEIAEQLLADIPFINRKSIIYGKGNKNRAVPLTQAEDDYEFAQITPYTTVFEELKKHAIARGMLFFSMPDGTFVFGEPLTSGKAEYTLIKGKNILEGERTRDISKRYKTVTVTGQQQGTDLFGPEDINVSGVAIDADFPFTKPFVAQAEHDGQDPQKYAKILMEKQQFDGFSLTYKTHSHSQTGKNYQVNAICHVKDERFSIDDDFLIYGRTFEMSRDGVFTTLKLSKLGILPV